ncbi:MAG: hypothetical protein U0Q16_02560 [Bryobacteraceae bacterium]
MLEANHLWATVADQIWPGASKLQAPFVYALGQHEYAIGFPRSLTGFSETGESLLGRPIQSRPRTVALNISASFPVDGIPAVLLGSPEGLGRSPGHWIITAGHEMFHVWQAANGSQEKVAKAAIGPAQEASWQLTFPFPYKDADIMHLVHLQGYLVWLAAQSASQEESAYNIGTALDAAKVYRANLARITGDEKAYRYSQFQEWSEGGAAFFEYRLAQKAAAASYQPTAAYASLPGYRKYEEVWRDAYESRPFLTKHAGRATRSRDAFYHLGAGKALALDKADMKWKEKYFLPDIWFDDLLTEAVQKGN